MGRTPSGEAVDPGFWTALDTLVARSRVVIDRPSGSAHPRYPDVVYPLPYGYLEGTCSSDGGGIDVWVGSIGSSTVDAVVCTIDLAKSDAEIKVLIGCSMDDRQCILEFLNRGAMGAMLVERFPA
jgi:inorganic pyrophosphatase